MLKTVISLGLAALVAAQPSLEGSVEAPMRGDDGAWGSLVSLCVRIKACLFNFQFRELSISVCTSIITCSYL